MSPFQSKAKSRFMFAQHPKMAKEWASKTDYSRLPDKKSQKKLGDLARRKHKQV